MRGNVTNDNFGDFYRPNFLYTYLDCRLLAYTYQKQASKLLANIMEGKSKFGSWIQD